MLAFLCVAQFMVFLDVSIVNVALPSIQHGLKVSQSDLPYVVTAYGTILGGCLVLGSRLADTFGRRRLLQIGLGLFGLASLVGGCSQEAVLLFVCRGVQGFGAAMIAPAALSTLTVTFAEGEARNKALGVWGGLAGIASVAGVVFGGLLTQGPGWRWIFFINVPIAVVAVLLAPRILPESQGERRPFDIPGAVLVTGSLMLLIYALDEAISYGWGSARVLPELIAAPVLFIAFIVVERRKRDPLVPFSIFRVNTLRTANMATVFFLGGVVSLFFFASLFMQQVLGYDPIKTGMAYVPQALMAGVAAGIASQLVTKTAAKPVLMVGLLLCAAGLFLMSRLHSDASYASGVLPAYLIFGAGMGFSFVPLQIAAQIGVEDRQAGLAAGLINTSQELGGALGLAVAATIALHRLPQKVAADRGDPARVQHTLTHVYHHAFTVGYCLILAALVLSLMLPMLKAAPQPQQENSDETEGATVG
ncbi:MFS transporter [Streptomyces sp. HPF1205]|uniref:MFS transporter n=1 Tax=Streptomyces sp. HPF1205 TaxID=2873262 RepID=UPI001CED7B1D|nr:MFS transporter [Streptomyces sp. HPF1205]